MKWKNTRLHGHIKRIRESERYKRLQNLGIGFWIFILVTFCLGFIFAFYIKEAVTSIVSTYGYVGILVAAIFLELLVQPVGPDLVIIFAVLMTPLNHITVLLVVLVGCYIALYVAYIIGKKIGSAGIEKVVGKKTYAKVQNSNKSERWFMFLGATTPVPYIPYLTGMWKFNLKDILLYVAIPRTIRLMIVLLLTYVFGIELLHLGMS